MNRPRIMARVAVAVGRCVGTRVEHSPAISRLRHRHSKPLALHSGIYDSVIQRVQHRPRTKPEEGAGDLDGDVHSALASGRSYFTISSASIWLRMWPRISRALEPVPITPVQPPLSWWMA